MSSKEAFDRGVYVGELIGEGVIALLALSGSGSVVFGAIKTAKTIDFVASSYRRIDKRPTIILSDAIDAIHDAF